MTCPWQFVESHRTRLRKVWLSESKLPSHLWVLVDDCISDASIGFVKNAPNLNPAVWRKYLEVSVKNRIIDMKRARRDLEMDALPAVLDEVWVCHGLLADIEVQPLLSDLFDHVKPLYRQVLAMDMAGHSAAVGARLCGISLPAYKSRLYRARVEAAKYLGVEYTNEK